MSDDSPNDMAGPAPENIAETLRAVLATHLREEVGRAVRLSMNEGEFLRKLGAELRLGMAGDGEAAAATGDAFAAEDTARIGEILDDVSAKLELILQTTERSAIEIIELVERRLAAHGEMVELARTCLEPGLRGRLLSMLEDQNADLMRIMTCLSFQDLTGQRVKRVLDSLAKARAVIRNLDDRAGAGERFYQPDASEPTTTVGGYSQAEVDALLGRLGM